MIRWATGTLKLFSRQTSLPTYELTPEDQNKAEKLARTAIFLLVLMLVLIIVRFPFAIVSLLLTLIGMLFKGMSSALDWIIGELLGVNSIVNYAKNKLKKNEVDLTELKKKYGVPT